MVMEREQCVTMERKWPGGDGETEQCVVMERKQLVVMGRDEWG